MKMLLRPASISPGSGCRRYRAGQVYAMMLDRFDRSRLFGAS